MLEHSTIIALLVLSIWYTLQEGEIFGKVGVWLENHTPEAIHDPLFACNVCMTFWYGSALYWLIFGNNWIEWLIVVIVAMGINIVVNKLSPDK